MPEKSTVESTMSEITCANCGEAILPGERRRSEIRDDGTATIHDHCEPISHVPQRTDVLDGSFAIVLGDQAWGGVFVFAFGGWREIEVDTTRASDTKIRDGELVVEQSSVVLYANELDRTRDDQGRVESEIAEAC
jgi:hypothetical protein